MSPEAHDREADSTTTTAPIIGKPKPDLPSVEPLLTSFRLDGRTALVVGDHTEIVKSLAASLASLGARVAEGDLESAATGTWAGNRHSTPRP